MTRAELIQYITDNVYPNARNEVTAPMVRDSLLEIVDFLGDAATYNIGMVASGNQGLVTGGNVNTAIALALLPYYTAQETGQAIDDAIARIGLGQAAYKNIGQVAENNTDLVTGGQVYTAINTALTSAIKFQGISDTPLTDGSTTNPIQINGQSYTAKKGDMVVYGGNEFLWVGNKWQQMGDESSYALKTIQITGTGYLTGGGDLTQSRTLDISATAKGYIDHGEAAYNYFPGGVLDSTHLPSMYIGTTSVQFTAAAQNLTGISSVRATSNVLTLFEWDVTNSAWHFHGNIYTDGWFSGGGISPGGGGGGGGIDPVAMWRLLTNDPSLTQYDDYTKISADHINFPVTSVVGLTGAITKQQIAQALELGSLAYKSSLSVSDIPDLSGTYLPLAGGNMTGRLNVAITDAAPIIWNNQGAGYNAFSTVANGLWLQNVNLSGVATSTDINLYVGVAKNLVYHSGNSNKSDVAWACSTLNAAGNCSLGDYVSTNGNEINSFQHQSSSSPYALELQTSSSGNLYLCNGGGNIGAGTYTPLKKFHLHGGTGLFCQGTGQASIDTGLMPIMVGCAGNHTYSAGCYYPGIGFNHLAEYSAPNFRNSPQAWIGTRAVSTPGSETDSLVFAVKSGTATTSQPEEKMCITPEGYVGLGIPSPTATLDVAGSIRFHNSNGAYFTDVSNGFRIVDPGWHTSLVFYNNYTSGSGIYVDDRYTLYIQETGGQTNFGGVVYSSVGIYTDGWFSGGGVASSSDRRLKKNIKNFAYTPKLLLAIRPREWDWKDGSAMVGHAAGFVAQEIEPIMPYAVDGTRNFKALFYDRFHALEIAGLQDHERRIVELERAVKERDKKIAKLEKMLKLN